MRGPVVPVQRSAVRNRSSITVATTTPGPGRAESVKLPSGRVAIGSKRLTSLEELKFGFSSVGRYSTKAATGLPVVSVRDLSLHGNSAHEFEVEPGGPDARRVG